MFTFVVTTKRRRLDAQISSAWECPIEAKSNDSSKVNIFNTFCKDLGYNPLSHSKHPFTLPWHERVQMLKRFVFWLQNTRGLGCDFNGARAYVAAVVRKLDLPTNPFDKMPRAYLERLKLAFNKNVVPNEKPKIAMPMKLANNLIKKWCVDTPHESFWGRPLPIMSYLGTALLTYAVTALRAGNILLSSSGENRKEMAIHIEDIHEFVPKKGGKSMMFIINNRSKTSKMPIITPVPFNPSGDTSRCAASRLRRLCRDRFDNDNAAKTDFLFVNPRTKNGPLTTNVFNKEVKNFIKAKCKKDKLPEDLARFFSAKSFRKMVSSEMKEEKCSPQEVAKKLGHNTIDAQLSYMCGYYNKKTTFVRHLYRRLNM